MTFHSRSSVTFKVKLIQIIMIYLSFIIACRDSTCMTILKEIIVMASIDAIRFDLWTFIQGHLWLSYRMSRSKVKQLGIILYPLIWCSWQLSVQLSPKIATPQMIIKLRGEYSTALVLVFFIVYEEVLGKWTIFC